MNIGTILWITMDYYGDPPSTLPEAPVSSGGVGWKMGFMVPNYGFRV